MTKHFSIAEANQLLQKIRPMLDEVVSIYQEIMAHQPDLWPAIERSAGNGGNPTLSRVAESFDRLDALLLRIQDTGAIVKDIASGLLDFPAMRGGQEVYLCWKHGESSIEFWHDIEAGFAGRKPMSDF